MKYTSKRIVTKKEIDQLNHVNNIIYLKWVQDVSAEHWLHLCSENMHFQKDFAWVVIRHEIDYLKPAYLNDEIILETYVDSIGMVKSNRCVIIKSGDAILAKAKTTWVFLNATTLKPNRITPEVKKVMLKGMVKEI